MADSGHPPAELHERLLICRTIKLNAGAHGGHRRCCHAQMQKNAQNKPQIARLILCVHTTLQVYCNLFLTFCFRRARGWLDSKRASLWEALLNARVHYSARKNSGFRSRRPSSAAAICASSAFRSPFSVPFSVR